MNKCFVGGMRAALFDSDLNATRLGLALSELLWAVMLLWPGDSFLRPTYAEMSQIAPEWCWGLAFLFTSLIQFCVVAFRLCDTRAAWLFSGWNSVLWVTSVVSMLISVQPPPAAIAAEITSAIFATFIFARPIINKLGEVRCAKQRQLAL